VTPSSTTAFASRGSRLAAIRQVIITAARVSSTMGKRIALTSIFKWRIVTR
jgi:hypothetical protein